MAAVVRSFSEVLRDIVGNVKEIVRSEMRLAKTEILEEAAKVKSSTLLLGVGAITAIFAILFLLLAIVYGLALVVPSWAAAVIVGVALAVVASVLLTSGVTRFKQIHPTPARTIESIKENVAWAKQHSR